MQTKEIYEEILLKNPADLQQPTRVLWNTLDGWSKSTQLLSLAVVFVKLLQRNGLSHVNVLSEAFNLIENDDEGYLK